MPIYPIPAANAVTIDFAEFAKNSAGFELFDSFGKKVKEAHGIKEGKYILNRHNLPAGIYSLTIYVNDNISRKKIVFE